MWLQKWILDRYMELRLKIGMNIGFTFEEAKEILSYDSEQTLYKVLNELEKLNIIQVERAKEDERQKKYKIILDLKDLPYAGLTVPTDYEHLPQMYRPKDMLFETGSMAVYGTTAMPPSRAFDKVYDKEGKGLITLMPKKPSATVEELLIEALKELKSGEVILRIIINSKIDLDAVIKNLNSYQKRYLGALLEILNKKEFKNIVKFLYDATEKDKRVFSVYPKIREMPKEYREVGKKWRINLNIEKVDTNELRRS